MQTTARVLNAYSSQNAHQLATTPESLSSSRLRNELRVWRSTQVMVWQLSVAE